MKKHYLTYEELRALALKHYNEGGDATYECLDEKTFNEDPYYQTMTEEDAIKTKKYTEDRTSKVKISYTIKGDNEYVKKDYLRRKRKFK